MKQVLKWNVPVDDQPHEIGRGRVVHIGAQTGGPHRHGTAVQVWTEEDVEGGPMIGRVVQVVGTGHRYNDSGRVIGSVVINELGLVWHVVEY